MLTTESGCKNPLRESVYLRFYCKTISCTTSTTHPNFFLIAFTAFPQCSCSAIVSFLNIILYHSTEVVAGLHSTPDADTAALIPTKFSVAWRMSQVLSFNASSASTSPSQPAPTCRGNKTNKYTAFALYTRIHLSFFALDVRLRYGSNIAAARQTSAQSPSHNSTSPRFTPLLPPRPERQPHPRRDAGRDSRIRRCHRFALELAICAMGPLAFQGNLPTYTLS
jgi:hypothetical protein